MGLVDERRIDIVTIKEQSGNDILLPFCQTPVLDSGLFCSTSNAE